MLLKKLFFVTIFICLFSFSVYSAEEPTLSAQSAVLINAETLEIIYEKNAHNEHSMASTTKIMTALLAIESGRLFQTVTASNMSSEGTSIGLKDGYKMSLETLVWGMLLESGNDAAKLTANFLAGDEKAFSYHMNRRAALIGMADTNFVTASGLDSKDHYSTAYDMALLGAEAIKNPIFREICSSERKTVRYIEPDISLTFINHNRLLRSCEGVFGIKTGFTKKSGRCLVSACQREGITLIAVTLNAGDDWNDHIKLYTYGYNKTYAEKASFRLPHEINLQGGKKGSVAICLESREPVFSYSGEKGNITQKIYLPAFVYAPVKCGDTVGRAEIFRNGIRIYSSDIIASEAAESIEYTEKQTLIKRMLNKLTDIFVRK